MIQEIIADNPDLLHALVLDTNYIALADTDIDDVGVDYSGDEASGANLLIDILNKNCGKSLL